jgi:hypothetical protein
MFQFDWTEGEVVQATSTSLVTYTLPRERQMTSSLLTSTRLTACSLIFILAYSFQSDPSAIFTAEEEW